MNFSEYKKDQNEEQQNDINQEVPRNEKSIIVESKDEEEKPGFVGEKDPSQIFETIDLNTNEDNLQTKNDQTCPEFTKSEPVQTGIFIEEVDTETKQPQIVVESEKEKETIVENVLSDIITKIEDNEQQQNDEKSENIPQIESKENVIYLTEHELKLLKDQEFLEQRTRLYLSKYSAVSDFLDPKIRNEQLTEFDSDSSTREKAEAEAKRRRELEKSPPKESVFDQIRREKRERDALKAARRKSEEFQNKDISTQKQRTEQNSSEDTSQSQSQTQTTTASKKHGSRLSGLISFFKNQLHKIKAGKSEKTINDEINPDLSEQSLRYPENIEIVPEEHQISKSRAVRSAKK